MSNKAVWCKDCKYGATEPYQGGIVCVNPDSDWCCDYPPEYGSCEFCAEREG